MKYALTFPTGTVTYQYSKLADYLQGAEQCILLVDSHVASLYAHELQRHTTIIINATEEEKSWKTIATIGEQLLQLEAYRKTMLIGIGGGIVTDVTGFAASVYMRGIPFGLVPTTLLGMVDAAIGGKNGVNLGLHKNILGTINQPQFILFDTAFLQTLPDEQWSNGFAEVIKYACLFDAALFDELAQHDIAYYKQNKTALDRLIERCADWKNKIVLEDEQEKGNRKLLNFGHTAGHAIETLYHIPHGYAVAIGMTIACRLSEEVLGINTNVRIRLQQLLAQYGLPAHHDIDVQQVMELLRMDKKRNTDTIDYILLKDIGQGVIQPLSPEIIEQTLITFSHAGNH